jgi:multimeric flavodoxin WrbA
MKVVAFNGSARKDGNTAIAIGHVFRGLEEEGIATEMIQFSGRQIRGCLACYKCWEKKDKRCINDKDDVNAFISKMIEADGIILASPTYFSDVSAEMKAVIDRCGMVSRANDHIYKRKVGAAIAVHRRGGAIHALDTLNHFFLGNNMIMPGSSYWAFAVAREIGQVEQDEEGMQTMNDLGQNMAWLMKKLNS